MKKLLCAALAASVVLLGTDAAQAADKKAKGKKGKTKAKQQAAKPHAHPTGYTDTPFLPGGKWRVHDDTRPRPKVITPGNVSGAAPSDAVILFDGSDLSEWVKGDGKPATWTVQNGFMEVPPKSSGKGGAIKTKRGFGDCQLHIEWATPHKVEGNSQGRGNSGVFFHDGTYEIQVLDSYDNKSYADGQASALYGWKPPLVNASRKPGEWQTYDIIFESPKWDKEGKLVKKAYVTVMHNGVVTHHRQEILGGTGHKRVAQYKQHAAKGSIQLQDHNNPTRFRNIWIRELDLNSNN
jgi:hypothetical protein